MRIPMLLLACASVSQAVLPAHYLDVSVLLLAHAGLTQAVLPAYYLDVLANTVGVQGGAGVARLDAAAVLGLEQQMKRVVNADPRLDLNLTMVRALSDYDVYRLLTLAVIGNFTSIQTGVGAGWQQPCSIAVKPGSGELVALDPGASSDTALRVLLLVLCCVQFKRWMDDEFGPGKRAGTAVAGSREKIT